MYKPMQTYNRSFIKSSCSYLAILSCFVCLPLPVYAYYTSGSCKACSTGCSDGYTSTKPSSSQCYTNTSSYFSCSSASDVTCYINASICSSTTYPYTSKSNATMSGACTGYRSTAGGACSGSSTTYYKSFTCNTNYCKSGSACYRYYSSCSAYNSSYRASDGRCGSTKYASTVRNSSCGYHTCYTGGYTVCSASTYPYTSITNATMSSTKCTGRRGTVGGSCSTSSDVTYYSGYSCNSGYCGTNCITSCSTSCPSGSDTIASGKCYTAKTSAAYTNCSTCSSTDCYTTATWCDPATYKYQSMTNGSVTGSSCTGYQGTNQGACTANTKATRYSDYTCNTGYCKSTSTQNCLPVCDAATYPYTSSNYPDNSTLSNPCTGPRTGSGSTCGSGGTYYKTFTCKSGYCKSGSACYLYYSSCSAYNSSYRASDGRCGSTKLASTVRNSSCGYHTCYTGGYTVCDATTYPYTSSTLPANASSVSGSPCTGRRGTVGGSCTTTSNDAYHPSFTCKSGYVKVGNKCEKYYASCSAAGYSEFAENCKSGYYKTIYLSDGTSKKCCTSFCSGVSKASCSGTFTHQCYTYNGTSYGTCAYASCAAAGYKYAASSYPACKSGTHASVKLTSGSTVVCCNTLCSGNSKSSCPANFSTSCTAYNGTAYGTCSCSGTINSACTKAGYSYSIASAVFSSQSAAHCNVTGGTKVYVGYMPSGSSRYCYTCCR